MFVQYSHVQNRTNIFEFSGAGASKLPNKEKTIELLRERESSIIINMVFLLIF